MREYTANEKAAGKMIIRFYNMQAGLALRCGSDENPSSNINMTLQALEKLNGDTTALKNHVREYVANTPESERNYFDCMVVVKPAVVEQVQEATASAPPVSEQSVASSLGILEQAVAQIIAKTQAEKIESEIMGSVEQYEQK